MNCKPSPKADPFAPRLPQGTINDAALHIDGIKYLALAQLFKCR